MTQAPVDPYVAERIRTALVQDPRVNELGLRVVLVGMRVFVTGTVATGERRDGIASVIHEQFPDLDVQNDVVVQQVARRPDHETMT